MSEYNLSHTGKELDDAISKVKSGYILPSETVNITENVTDMDITNGKLLNVNVPVPDGYINFTRYYTETYSQTASTLEYEHTFTCGFRPKVVLISVQTDTTLSTTYGVIFAFRTEIDGLTTVGDGIYKLGVSNRIGSFGGAITITDTGFTFSHGTIGLAKSVSYDIYAWG